MMTGREFEDSKEGFNSQGFSKIIDNGSHKALMEKSELYKNFYEKQIQK